MPVKDNTIQIAREFTHKIYYWRENMINTTINLFGNLLNSKLIFLFLFLLYKECCQ